MGHATWKKGVGHPSGVKHSPSISGRWIKISLEKDATYMHEEIDIAIPVQIAWACVSAHGIVRTLLQKTGDFMTSFLKVEIIKHSSWVVVRREWDILCEQSPNVRWDTGGSLEGGRLLRGGRIITYDQLSTPEELFLIFAIFSWLS